MKLLTNTTKFFSEVRGEMQKVTWPTREEIMGSTAVVLMTMLILSTFIGVSDFILAQALSVILR
jgi:preprotein translocase subunit SecE